MDGFSAMRIEERIRDFYAKQRLVLLPRGAAVCGVLRA